MGGTSNEGTEGVGNPNFIFHGAIPRKTPGKNPFFTLFFALIFHGTTRLSTELILITLLYAVAALTWIGVISVRGLWRTVAVSVLTVLCMGAALFHTARYRAYMQAVSTTPPVSAASAPIADVSADPSNLSFARNLREAGRLHAALAEARALHGELAGEDPASAHALSDDEHRRFEERAESLLSRSRRLRAEALSLAGEMPPALEPAAAGLVRALQSFEAAARDFHRYFRAKSRDEERLLEEGFRRGVHTGTEALRQAERRAGIPSPDAAP